MSTINGKACVVNGTPVDKVFSNGRQVYGRNLYLNSKKIEDVFAIINSTKATVEPFDSTTNMFHIVAEQGNRVAGVYLSGYANGKIPDNSDWSYSADAKGTGNIYSFGIEAGSSKNKPIGTIGSEWSRISQTGHVDNEIKTIVMYFDTASSPVDVYIKLPKLEIGKIVTPWTPAPEDVM